MVHTWIVGRCIVYTGIRLLMLICSFISSFIFLSNFQTLKFFVTLFSRTVRSRRSKLGTYVDSGQMYGVYRCTGLSCPLGSLPPGVKIFEGSLPPGGQNFPGYLHPHSGYLAPHCFQNKFFFFDNNFSDK